MAEPRTSGPSTFNPAELNAVLLGKNLPPSARLITGPSARHRAELEAVLWERKNHLTIITHLISNEVDIWV